MVLKYEKNLSNTPESFLPKDKKQGRRTWKGIVLGGILPLAVLLAGGLISAWLMSSAPQAKQQPRKRNATLVEVKTVEYTSQGTFVSGMGTVIAARTVELIPQVSGKIIEVNPSMVPGGYVQKGEVLLTIDPTDYYLAVRERAADVVKAQSDLHLEKGKQLIAQKEYDLLGQLVSDQEKALILRQPQLDNLQATLEATRANLERAKTDLARTELTAPFNAVILKRNVNLGTQASQSSLLATLVDTDLFWIEASVPVSQLRWLKIPRFSQDEGALVRVYDTASWGNKETYRQGRVIRLKSDLESEGRMARVLIEVEDPLSLAENNQGKPRMLMGSYVRVEIEGNVLDSAFAVEREFVRNGNSVWVMTPEGKLAIRPIDIAFRGTEQLLITGGVEAGEQLILTDLSAPVEGMALRTLDSDKDQTAAKQSGEQGGQS